MFTSSLFAVNPADPTNTYRYSDKEFYKFVYDGGPTWMFVQLPVKDNLSLYFQGWQNEERDIRRGDVRIIKRLSLNFDAGLIFKVDWKNESFTPKAELMLDFHTCMFGIGTLIPLQSERDLKIGPRFYFDDLDTYLLFSEDNRHRFGLSYQMDGIGMVCFKGMKLEGAYERDDIWYLNMSRSFKTKFGFFIPELRLKFTPDENFYGVGLGFRF